MPSRGVESQRPGPEVLVLVDLGDARVLLLVIILIAAIGGLARLDLCIGRLGAPDGDDGRPGARVATSTFPGNAASQRDRDLLPSRLPEAECIPGILKPCFSLQYSRCGLQGKRTCPTL